MEDGRWGLVTTNGDIIVPFKYDDIEQFDGDFTAKVVLNGKKGVVDFKKEIIPPIYDEIKDINTTPYQVKLGDRWGFISEEGKEVTPLKYDEVKGFVGRLAGVKSGDKWGFINFNGEEIIPRKYDDVIPYSNEAVAVKLKNKWGVADTTGKLAVPVKYKEITGINIHHDDKKGVTKLYVNVIIKKENILLVYETKSKKSPDGGYNYKKWKKSK